MVAKIQLQESFFESGEVSRVETEIRKKCFAYTRKMTNGSSQLGAYSAEKGHMLVLNDGHPQTYRKRARCIFPYRFSLIEETWFPGNFDKRRIFFTFPELFEVLRRLLASGLETRNF